MAAVLYLAMTAAEFSASYNLPEHIAWMACHFSPYGTGLINLPAALPAGSILILNDRIPICGHTKNRVVHELQQTVETFDCSGVLLDFEVPHHPELKEIAACIYKELPCPAAVSHAYAADLSCPVFLPPCPHHTSLAEYIAPWQDREIWLDLAVNAETITLTAEGSTIQQFPPGEIPENGHPEKNLHCHYRTESWEDHARFTLWRTKEDLEALAQEAEELGVSKLAGLFQEWNKMQKPVCKSADRF